MSSYLFNNDLVGKDKDWGLKDNLLPWQLSIYGRYYKMCDRCNNPNSLRYYSYGAVGIENHFTSLSHYYHTLKKDPLWPQFKKNPELYDIDKDIKCGHGSPYSPDTIMIVTKSDNLIERGSRCGFPARIIILDGVEYSSVKEASLITGISVGNIAAHAGCCKTSKGNTFSNTWKDRLGNTHSAYYK